MNRFLIFCRPRSKSAWVSNLLTYGSAAYLHEPFSDGGSALRLRQRMDGVAHAGNFSCVGACDTGLIHDVDDLLARFKGARLVLLQSSGASWNAWKAQETTNRSLARFIEDAWERGKERLSGLAQRFQAERLVDERAHAAELCAHLDVDFNAARWGLLRRLNVQADFAELERRVRKGHR